MTGVEIAGHCAPRFAKVKDAFAKNFAVEGEVGASFAATVDGEMVIDLWGGSADAAGSRPWQRDTLANVWSTTKAMNALCAHMLVDRGLLDLDAPVARYWPEFAAAGKERLPVRYVLSHQAGLAGLSTPMPEEAVLDWTRMTRALAEQAPLWEPGTRSGYHALTI
ncbi:MAG: serine hydrolase domain-containing protein, partial [Solirubrobacteraceae bacterium]